MSMARAIRRVTQSQPTLEGAGVHLKRALGYHDVPQFDPFLLLDDFHSTNPDQYIRGFPWHPHRGIETITYVLHGTVEHGDSIGNSGVISAGDVQWMTAGSGIVHQEMPKGDRDGLLQGFQLWANLPARSKMMQPRYREIKDAEIPDLTLDDGVRIRIICGEAAGVRGPVSDVVIEPVYLDISVPASTTYRHPVSRGHTVFAYVIDGRGSFEPDPGSHKEKLPGQENLVLFDDGTEIEVTTLDESVRFLLVSGKPIGEPIAWRGPIVMNTDEELHVAFEEYQKGTFLKHDKH